MLALGPFLIQGLVMAVDEFYCHHRRDLGRWERLGHPVDTAVFLLCLIFLVSVTPSRTALGLYVGLSLASCLVITKDEWEHQTHCDGFESWLHSLLFMLHPCLLIWAGHLWWTSDAEGAFTLRMAMVSGLGFLAYQITYWNWWRPRRDRDQQRIL